MHFRLSNGLALAYHVRGAGRLVMFLHTIGTRGAFWDPLVDRIEDRCRCVTRRSARPWRQRRRRASASRSTISPMT